MTDGAAAFWYTRFTFERALALVYLIAFLVAANQFVPLLGEHGLLPVARFVRYVPFSDSPSLFYFFATDRAFTAAAWTGVALSGAAFPAMAQQLRVLGIDISTYQGDITPANWATLKSTDSRDFVFIRSSRGGTTGERVR